MKFLTNLRYVVGIDPGLSTGLYAVRLVAKPHRVELAARYQGEPGNAIRLLTQLCDDAAEFDETVIVAGERFTSPTSPKTPRSAQPLAQQILGAIENILGNYRGAAFHLQTPADAKKLAPNDVLRDFGFYTHSRDVETPDADDVNDAARHVLLLIARRRASVYDDLWRAAERRRQSSQR